MSQTVTMHLPSIEFYIHPSMGLCFIRTKRDGSQATAQYLDDPNAIKELRDWLEVQDDR